MPTSARRPFGRLRGRVDEGIDPYARIDDAQHPVGADYISARGSGSFASAYPGAYTMRPYGMQRNDPLPAFT